MSGKNLTCTVCGEPQGIVHVAVGWEYRLVCWACLGAGKAPGSYQEPSSRGVAVEGPTPCS